MSALEQRDPRRWFRGPFAGGRILAAAALAAVILAAIYPLLGYGWHEVGGLLVCAAVLAWISHSMCDEARRGSARAIELRRFARSRPRNVSLVPPVRRRDDVYSVRAELLDDDWTEDDVLASDESSLGHVVRWPVDQLVSENRRLLAEGRLAAIRAAADRLEQA